MRLPVFEEYFSGEAGVYLHRVLKLALDEDGPDLTSDGIFSESDTVTAMILAKENSFVAGLPVIPLVMDLCAAPVPHPYTWNARVAEGSHVKCGTIVADISGQTRQVLRAERVILNMISRMSGIANLTAKYVDALEGTGVTLLDTRKTLPGLRYPDKYGVLVGGGHNHRRNLAEMLMIKDNHIDAAGSITGAVRMLRDTYGEKCPPIEVECRNCEEVREAVSCNVSRIMMDNMDAQMLDKALPLVPDFIETEISGGVSLDNIRALVTAGRHRATFVSVGRITHSAPIADFSMRLAREARS